MWVTQKIDWTNKKVMITGASYGLGEFLAYSYAKQGASLFLIARSTQKLQRVKENCEALGSHVQTFNLDLSKEDTWTEINSSVDHIDVLVLNHCISTYGKYEFGPKDLESIQEHFQINFIGSIGLFEQLIDKTERVFVMTSIAGKYGYAHSIPYAISKGAINTYFKSMIAINRLPITMVYLGSLDTPGHKQSSAINSKFQVDPKDVADTIYAYPYLYPDQELYCPNYLKYIDTAFSLSQSLYNFLTKSAF